MRRSLGAGALGLLVLLATVVALADAPQMQMQPGMPAMDRYQFGLLRKGKAWTAKRTAATDSIQSGHMANIHRMHELGLLIGAGPLDDPTGDLRGVFVFRLLNTGEAAAAGPFLVEGGDYAGVFVFRGDSATARAAIETDPAVASGHMAYRQIPWFVAYGTFPGDTL